MLDTCFVLKVPLWRNTRYLVVSSVISLALPNFYAGHLSIGDMHALNQVLIFK